MLAIKEDGIESGDWDVLDRGWGGHVDQFPKFKLYDAKKESRRQMKPSPKDYELTKAALSAHDDFIDIDTYNEMIKTGSIEKNIEHNPRTVVVAFVSNYLTKRYAWVHLLDNPNEYHRVLIGSSGETAKSLRRESKITKQELGQIIKEELSEILGSRKKKRPFHVEIGERVLASVYPGKYGDHGGVLPGTIIATGRSTREDAPEWFEYRDDVEQKKYEKAVAHVNSRMLNKDESDEDYMRDAKWLETSAPQPAMAPVGTYPAVKLDIGVIDTFHLTALEGTSESTATDKDGPTGLHQGYFRSNQS